MTRFLFFFLISTSLFAQPKKRYQQYEVAGLKVDVYLPSNYSEKKEYPVVYANDGEWLFGDHSWKLDYILEEWTNLNKIEPLILVAIHNQGERESKFLPYQDPYIGKYEANAEKYTRKIVKELVPFIDKKFSTSDQRALMGASFGGLHSVWAGLKCPDVFQFIIAQSPSFWVNNFSIHEEAKFNKGQKIWIDIGTNDWDDVLTMYYSLSQKGYTPGSDLFYYEHFNGSHNGDSWSERLLYPLILFSKGMDNRVMNFQLQAEYIPSMQRKDLFYFSRVNPVVTMKNGVKFTPFPYVEFKSNEGFIKVSPYGKLEIEPGKTDKLIASYGKKESSVKIKWKDNPMNK